VNTIAAVLHLSPREVECCALLADGESYKKVGKELGISERTARFHASNAALRLLAVYPWLRRGEDNGPRKVVLRWYRSAEFEAFKPKAQAA
jgi:hypothetical protein